jgi:hypothetical protein
LVAIKIELVQFRLAERSNALGELARPQRCQRGIGFLQQTQERGTWCDGVQVTLDLSLRAAQITFSNAAVERASPARRVASAYRRRRALRSRASFSPISHASITRAGNSNSVSSRFMSAISVTK